MSALSKEEKLSADIPKVTAFMSVVPPVKERKEIRTGGYTTHVLKTWPTLRKKRDNGQVLPAVTNDFLFHLPTNLKEQMNCGETGSGIVTVNSFFGELTVMCLTANQRPDVFSLLTGRYKLKTLRLSSITMD